MVGGWTKTKLMLNSTQVEVKVEDGVELGNTRPTTGTKGYNFFLRLKQVTHSLHKIWHVSKMDHQLIIIR